MTAGTASSSTEEECSSAEDGSIPIGEIQVPNEENYSYAEEDEFCIEEKSVPTEGGAAAVEGGFVSVGEKPATEARR